MKIFFMFMEVFFGSVWFFNSVSKKRPDNKPQTIEQKYSPGPNEPQKIGEVGFGSSHPRE